MLVLGLDPGLATTGFGLVAEQGRGLASVGHGVIKTPSNTPTADRLVQLHRRLLEVIDENAPDMASVEQLFFSSNARTAMVVGEARGVLLLTCAEAGLPIVEYTPMQIKQAITGYGKADKGQMQEMVRLLLQLDEIPRPDDAADALAVAICCHHSSHLERLLERDASTSA